MDACAATSRLRRHVARAVGAVGLLVGLIALPALTQASDPYPSRPVRLVLGYQAGGGTDVLARSIARKMGEALGTTVVVENKPGANGNIAAETVARAPADGYTLLYNTSAIILSPSLYPKLRYDPLRDLTPIGLAANQPLVLVASQASGIARIDDVVAYMKKHPGGLNYGSAGNGNMTHLSMLMFERSVGARGTHVPYTGEASALTDLVGGQIDLYMGTAAGVTPMVRDRQIRALAVNGLTRLPSLPDVPTLDETVAKGLEVGAWSGVMAPARTPPDIVMKLDAALQSALADKALQADFAARGVEIKHATSAQYATFLKFELARWSKLIKDARIRID